MAKLFKSGVFFVRDKVRGCDWFGKSITFTYRGEDAFKTLGGGILSLSIFGFLLFYMIFLLRVMFERSDVNTSKNTIVKDLANDKTLHYPAKHTFAFAVSWSGAEENLLKESSYVEVEAYEKSYKQLSDKTLEAVYKPLELELCGSNFPYKDQELVKKYGINTYL